MDSDTDKEELVANEQVDEPITIPSQSVDASLHLSPLSIDTPVRPASSRKRKTVAPDPKEMVVGIYMNAMDDVKLESETFYCDFDFFINWLADEDHSEEYKTYEWEDESLKFLNKFIMFDNRVDITIEFGDQGTMVNGNEGVWGETLEFKKNPKAPFKNIHWVRYTIRGIFKERFELQSFPVDVQDLTIHVSCTNHCSACKMTSFYDPEGFFTVGEYSTALDGKIKEKFDEYSVENFEAIKYNSPNGYDNVEFKVKVARKFFVYFYKIGIYIILITMSSVGVFVMDQNGQELGDVDKLGLLFTLLLTGVAIQFVVGTWLPNLSYVTLLDKYIICSFVIMFLMVLFVFTSNIMDIELDDDSENKEFLKIVSGITFILSQIVFVFVFWYDRVQERIKIGTPKKMGESVNTVDVGAPMEANVFVCS